MIFGMPLDLFILRIPAILIALTFHEFAHGWVAYRFGDRTAYHNGRLTLNPIAHLDPIGSLLLLFTFFGWAKPVPVDPRNFSRLRWGIVMVSLAGPLSNVLLALVFGNVLNYFTIHNLAVDQHLQEFLYLLVMINLGISFFNLLPIPPLDGSNIMLGILPRKAIPRYLSLTRYVPMIFIGMLIMQSVLRRPVLSMVLGPLYIPYFHFFKAITGWSFL